MCEECRAKLEESKEYFPEMLMVEAAYNHVMSDAVAIEDWGKVLDEFADRVASQNAGSCIAEALKAGFRPQAATEFFGEQSFKYGFAVGVACAEFYGDRFGKSTPPTLEEAEAEFNKRMEARAAAPEPGVAVTPEMAEQLRKMGVQLPDDIPLEDMRIVTSDDILRNRRPTPPEEETGKDGGAPGMYL